MTASRPTTPEQEVPRENSYLKVEKSYIITTKGRVRTPVNATAKRLMTQTMKSFNKPSASPESKYAAPRTKLYVNELVKKQPKFDVVTNFPTGVTRWARRHEGTICTHNGAHSLAQYCDVLGPHVCKKCIEVTNRRIIAEIQKETFPELEFSMSTLVAPKLASAVAKGEVLMSHRPTSGELREQERVSEYAVTPVSSCQKLRFPQVEGRVNPRDFRRAGIEREWHNRSRTFHNSRAPTEDVSCDSVTSPRRLRQVRLASSATSIRSPQRSAKRSVPMSSEVESND